MRACVHAWTRARHRFTNAKDGARSTFAPHATPPPPQPRDLTVPPPPPATRHHLPATTTTQGNRTALHLASSNGHAGVVGLLLGNPLMTEDCFNAKDDVSGGWWWGVGAVVVTAVLVLVVVAVE